MNLRTKRATMGAAALALAIATPLAVSSASVAGADDGHGHDHGQIKHVLLISVDGMHQSDLDWYVATH
ncbi:MAG TPA: hypothetical protein VNU75_12625, partial [Acidimicrobiales bacterium]|nr:hypothetical protein [Acidimicrobiales bacterium]